MKICTSCGEEKSLDLFPTANKKRGTKEGKCKVCKAIYKKKWHADNREYIANRPNKRWQRAKIEAIRRKKEWILSKTEYSELIYGDSCYYCGSELPKFGSGLDRVDNSVGYRLGNVIPCCTACNCGRGTHFTIEEWRIAMQEILKYRGFPESDLQDLASESTRLLSQFMEE